MKKINIALLAMATAITLPSYAYAGIAGFATPLETVLATLTGPVGRVVAIIGIVFCGIILVYKREELSGSFQLLTQVVLAISFISLSTTIVNTLFGFSTSGAIV